MRTYIKILFFMFFSISLAYGAKIPVSQHSSPVKITKASKPRRFSVQSFQFGFKPNKIVVNQGDHVVINFTTKDVSHGFYLKAYNIDVPVKKGQTKKIAFTADKKGKFTFRCSVYCGSGHNRMKGTLVVK